MAATRSRVGEGRSAAGAEVTAAGISRDGTGTAAGRAVDRGTTGCVFDGELKAADREQSHAQIQDADKKRNDDRRNNTELHGGGAAALAPASSEREHNQPNRIIEVRVIGVVNLLATVMLGNSGA